MIVPLYTTSSQVNQAGLLINDLIILNGLDINIFKTEYYFELDTPFAGYFVEKGMKELSDRNLKDIDSIFINPTNCEGSSYIKLLGSPFSSSVLHVIIHEWCHLYIKKFRDSGKDLCKTYQNKKRTFREKIYVNEYARTNIEEELVELMTIYIINPLLLYYICPERYIFVEDFIPNISTTFGKSEEEIFMYWYKTWNKSTVQQLEKRFPQLSFNTYSKNRNFSTVFIKE